GSTLDDYNNENVDHSDLVFIHGGSITMKQHGKRPIIDNVAPSGTPNWVKEFKQKSMDNFNRTITITTPVTYIPLLNNYLMLDPQYKDAFGNSLIRLTYDFNEHDHKLHDYISERCAEILEEMGAELVESRELSEHFDIVPAHNDHITGGVIMGDDPDTSV